jgi:cellulose synthase/poly-beta-1,6-N-acetylglucosamine synthase-like glycosyltransferase
MNYFKVSKATDLSGKDKKIYRFLEILPGALAWGTIIGLVIFSYLEPVGSAFFIILFDIYWLFLVLFLGTHLLISFRLMRKYMKVDWKERCETLGVKDIVIPHSGQTRSLVWRDFFHVIIIPTYTESATVLRSTLDGLVASDYPKDRLIVVLATEAREGDTGKQRAEIITKEYAESFGRFLVTTHPDNIIGELKGKGANQAWAAAELKRLIIDKENIDYDLILVSVFDADTIIYPGYFYCLMYHFLTVQNPYRSSFQPVPVYNNNLWEAPFFARVAAFSNTFWQMMQQLRPEKLATYSSHSMTWRALVDIGFWSPNMVSEDSRIFWHCFCYYQGDYCVEPLYFPVSMDICMDKSVVKTAKNLYRQQRRWGWGVENIPYLLFNTFKQWKTLPKGAKKRYISHIIVQLYGFHSWATNALITSILGWLPLLLGGDRFNATVLSNNLPTITKFFMTLAMVGMVISAIISVLILPQGHKAGIKKYAIMLVQWLFLPVVIILFGAIPGLEAQTRLMFGKYMGFWITPKHRE